MESASSSQGEGKATMNSRVVIGIVVIAGLALFFYVSSGNKKQAKQAAQQARQEVETQLQKVKERERKARGVAD